MVYLISPAVSQHFLQLQTFFVLKSTKDVSLRSSVGPDGQSEIKREIKCLLKDHESIYLDKDQIFFSWTFWPFQNSFSPHVKAFYFIFIYPYNDKIYSDVLLRLFTRKNIVVVVLNFIWHCVRLFHITQSKFSFNITAFNCISYCTNLFPLWCEKVLLSLT